MKAPDARLEDCCFVVDGHDDIHDRARDDVRSHTLVDDDTCDTCTRTLHEEAVCGPDFKTT